MVVDKRLEEKRKEPRIWLSEQGFVRRLARAIIHEIGVLFDAWEMR